jgi:toxin ParE1/3/4
MVIGNQGRSFWSLLSMLLLAITPNMGKVVSSLSDMGTIRQWRIKNFKDYLIFYKVQEEQVEVLRVLHGGRDLEDLLPFLDEEV